MPSNEVLDLLKRLFVLRDNQELLGKEFVNKFSQLIEDIPSEAGRLQILLHLVNLFPQEAHFWGHLARFYSTVQKQPADAIQAVNKAIELSPNDPLLYHMKGMCRRSQIYSIIDQWKNRMDCPVDKVEELKKLVHETSSQFGIVRKLDSTNVHGYISHIQCLIRVIDFGFSISGKDSRAEFLVSPSARWYQEIFDLAEDLLENADRIREGEKRGPYIEDCEMKLAELYGDYSRVLEGWNNLLIRQDIYRPPIRRQVVRTYVAKHSNGWDDLEPREIERIIQLLEENILEEPASSKNIRLWFQAARRSSIQNIDSAIERRTYWRANTDQLDAVYFLYILYVLKSLDGSTLATTNAQDLIRECSQKARSLRNRNYCFEWYGKKNGLKKLVHHSQLGDRDEESDFKNNEHLSLIRGRITKIIGPEAGQIELSSGLMAFFIPARGKKQGGYLKGRDENQIVDLYLGFSYDGLRARNVRDA